APRRPRRGAAPRRGRSPGSARPLRHRPLRGRLERRARGSHRAGEAHPHGAARPSHLRPRPRAPELPGVGMSKRIAIISEHASPLALLGGVDSGGQNVYVGQVARHLAALGYEVDVFTRRDDPMLPEIADWVHGVRVIHVPAGPPRQIRKEDLLPYMDKFTAYMLRCCKRRRRGYDLVHANFW